MEIEDLDIKILKVKGNCMTKENFIKMLDGMEFQFVENCYISFITGIIADGNNGNIEILRNTIDFN